MTARRVATRTWVALAALVLLLAVSAFSIIARTSSSPENGLARNPYLDPGHPAVTAPRPTSRSPTSSAGRYRCAPSAARS